MKLATGKITSLVAMSPQSCQIGRGVLEENELPEECEKALNETVEVILSMKSPNTVNKRAGSLLQYVKWFADSNRGNPFPILEKDVAAYLFHLKSGTWKPADPLLVSEIMHFHDILEGEEKPLLDRIAAGNVLAMVYGRCRASDRAFIKHAHLDYGDDNDKKK